MNNKQQNTLTHITKSNYLYMERILTERKKKTNHAIEIWVLQATHKIEMLARDF